MNILSVCDNGDFLSVLKIVKTVITIIRIIVPIILILSLAINYMKAVKDSDAEALTKSNKRSIYKIIAAILVFLIPTFINLITKITDPNNNTYLSCLNMATDENISHAYATTAQYYVDIAYNSLNRSDYNIAFSFLRKIKNEIDRKPIEEQLSKINYYIEIKERIVALSKNKKGNREEYKKIKEEIEAIEDENVRERLIEFFNSMNPIVSLGIEAGVFERSDYDSEMRYIEVIPEDATTNMPLIIYLHGIWSYSSFSKNAPNYLITKYVKTGEAYQDDKFILIVPRVVLNQASETGNVTWQTSQGKEQTKKLKGLIDFIVEKYSMDENRIIITGASLGGDGTWNMVESYPGFFAAAVPISGCANKNPIVQNYVSTPIIAYHGTAYLEDAYKRCVPAIYNKIKAANGNIELRVKQGYSHGQMQNVYTENNGAIFKWMLEQVKQ